MENALGDSKNRVYDVLVVGGGASGMATALLTARRGLRVALLEHNEVLGKKILATGNGKCNFANTFQNIDCYRGSRPQTAMELYKRFSLETILDFFESIGIMAKQRDGYWYPYSEQAASVRDAFVMELEEYGVKCILNCHVREIKKNAEEPYLVLASKRDILSGEGQTEAGKNKNRKNRSEKTVFGEEYPIRLKAYSVVLAGGGIAGNISGADGSCYQLAKAFGHTILEPIPALVQMKTQESFCKEIAGVRFPAMGTLYIDDAQQKRTFSEQGEYLFTEYGISGIPAMQLSRYAAQYLCLKGTDAGAKPKLFLDFFPDTVENELCELLRKRFADFPDRTLSEALNGLLPTKLNRLILKQLSMKSDMHITRKTWSGKTSEQLAQKMKRFELTIIGTNTKEHAQVTAGGVSMQEIVPETMESKLCKGLYIVGELADMDGTCGGYNLQWAWMSAMAAAEHLTQK